jgi:hypothetical protein
MTDTVPLTLQRWHAYTKAGDAALLDALLDDAAVFESPVVHTPQRGKAIASAYLRGAGKVLGAPSFRYVNEWYADRSAILEFEVEIDGIHINGIDMIFWNDNGLITRFKVMIRPLKAINLVHALMGAALAER